MSPLGPSKKHVGTPKKNNMASRQEATYGSRIATVREIHYCIEDLFATGTPTHTQNVVSAFNEIQWRIQKKKMGRANVRRGAPPKILS